MKNTEDAALHSIRKLRLQFFWGVGIGLAVFAGLLAFGGFGGLAEGLSKVKSVYFMAACALSLVNYCLRFLKWHFYLGRIDAKVPLKDSALTFVSGLSMSVTPGKLGEVLKSFMLKVSHGLPVARTAPVVIAERATDAFGLLILAGIGSLAYSQGTKALGALFLLGLAFVGLMQNTPVTAGLADRMKKLPRIGRLSAAVDGFRESSGTLFSMPSLALTIPMSAVSWGMEALSFHLILEGLSIHIGLLKAAFIFSFSSLLGALSMLPGGLGAAEGTLLGMLTVAGVPRGPASSGVFLVRLATLWLAVAVGAVGIASAVRRGLLRDRDKLA